MVTAVSGFIEQGGVVWLKEFQNTIIILQPSHIQSSFKKLAILSVLEPDISQQMDAYELMYVG